MTTQIPEGLDLRKDGTVWLHLDETRITLRRPKMRELRELREDLWHIADEHLTWLQTERERITELAEAAKDDPEDEGAAARFREASRDLQRAATLRIEPQRLGWATRVIERLAGRTVDPDDLPPWCASADFGSDLLNHWLTVPTRHGGR